MTGVRACGHLKAAGPRVTVQACGASGLRHPAATVTVSECHSGWAGGVTVPVPVGGLSRLSESAPGRATRTRSLAAAASVPSHRVPGGSSRQPASARRRGCGRRGRPGRSESESIPSGLRSPPLGPGARLGLRIGGRSVAASGHSVALAMPVDSGPGGSVSDNDKLERAAPAEHSTRPAAAQAAKRGPGPPPF